MAKSSKTAPNIWIDRINPTLEEIDTLIALHDFHELDRDAVLESNQSARVDNYPDYLFMVLHFPKYDPNNKRYIENEFNIFVSPEYLITFRYYQSTTVKKIYERYEQSLANHDVATPAFILYGIIDGYLDKTMRVLEKLHKDIKVIERDLFGTRDTEIIRDIMIKKRDIISIKHMMKPQIPVMNTIKIHMKEHFPDSEIGVYYENLQDKLEKISAESLLIQENIDSIEDALKSLFELETNKTIKYLTIFSTFMLPLTLVTSFFGMNIEE